MLRLQNIAQVLLRQRLAGPARWKRTLARCRRHDKSLCPRLAGGGSGDGGAFAVRSVHEIFQLFAGFEERNLLCRHFHFFTGLGVAPYSAAALASAETAKAPNLDLFAFLQGADDAVEDRFDNGLRFLARQFGYAQDFFDEVSLGQCGLLGHRPVASSPSLRMDRRTAVSWSPWPMMPNGLEEQRHLMCPSSYH